MGPTKSQDPDTVVPDNKNDSLMKSGHFMKTGGMCTLKREISPQKFHEIQIKSELKGETVLVINNFCNYIKTCLNAVTKLLQALLPPYQPIKRHS